MSPAEDSIAVIILNWKSAKDTSMVIEAIVQQDKLSKNIIVIDNASDDSSLEVIEAAMQPLCLKTFHVNADGRGAEVDNESAILLVQNSENSGYAGGNNLGIKLLLDAYKTRYFLIVNNDVRPRDGAIDKLVATMASDARIGFVSGTLVYPGENDIVQCVGGGCYHPLIGRSRLLGKGRLLSEIENIDLNGLNYLMGAYLLVRTEMLSDIGLMDEKYFLYAEEMDWQWRAKKAGWKLAVCRDAIIEHGDSGSTKGSGRSHLFYYYHNRAAILFNRKWYGVLFVCVSTPFVILGAIIQAKTPRNIAWALKGIFDGCLGKTGKLSGSI